MLGEDGERLGGERVPPVERRRVPLQELVRKLQKVNFPYLKLPIDVVNINSIPVGTIKTI